MIPAVLICDDSNLARKQLARILPHDWQSTIRFAGHGAEALATLKKYAFDWLFLDLNMPVMDGWDFLKAYLQKFATQYPETKVCILSSTIDPEDFVKAGKYKIVLEFISKPLTMEILNELKKSSQLKKYFN